MLTQAVALLFTHFVGDFVLQSSDMALNKATSLKWLFVHVATYTVVLFVGSSLLFGIELALTYTAINGLLHFITDFFTSKLNARLYQRESKRLFYTALGFDQFIHGASLLLTCEVLI